MARLTFLWHLHQPLYRTADGRVHAPWVLLHAAGEYLTLVRVLEKTGWAGQVLNLVPVFLEQLVAYRDGTARDPLLEALRTPARELAPDGKQELLRWAFMLHPLQLQRWPRLAEAGVKELLDIADQEMANVDPRRYGVLAAAPPMLRA